MSKFFELVKVRADFDGHGDFNGSNKLYRSKVRRRNSKSRKRAYGRYRNL